MTQQPEKHVLLQRFERWLRAHDSATHALELLCQKARPLPDTHVQISFLEPPYLLAGKAWENSVWKEKLSSGTRDAGAQKLASTAPPLLRHVVLTYGPLRLSEAWNCYFPEHLSKEVRQKLTDPERPFGAALGKDSFRRVRLPSSPETQVLERAGTVLEHWALLYPPTHTRPFACVREQYSETVLALCAACPPEMFDGLES